jgi:hypothetical protein
LPGQIVLPALLSVDTGSLSGDLAAWSALARRLAAEQGIHPA